MDNWDELDQFCQEWPHTPSADVAALPPGQREAWAALLARHEADLAIPAQLDHIRQQALGGSGVLLVQRDVHDHVRLYLLGWPALIDPRPDLAAPSVECRITVVLGPASSGARASVQVIGARRLEAGLPVTVEKFRAALMRALREPQRLQLSAPATDAHDEDGSPDQEADPQDQPSAANQPD